MRKFLLEALALAAISIICAVVANTLHARDRQLRLRTAEPAPLRRSGAETVATPATPAVAATSTATAIVATTSSTPLATPPPPPALQLPATVAATAAGITAPAPTAPLPALAPHPDKPWVEISSEQTAALHAAGAPFFDARRSEVFAAGHIDRAESVPVWEADLDQRIRAIYDKNLSPDGPIVVYCNGGNCEDSHTLAEKLWNIGLNNVYVYKDGYPDWVKRGGAVGPRGAQ